MRQNEIISFTTISKKLKESEKLVCSGPCIVATGEVC